MHKRISPHGDYDHMGEAVNLVNILKVKKVIFNCGVFNGLIERAKVACKGSNNNIDNHFVLQCKMIKLTKGATRKVIDYKLSRYACYLMVMNGNPRKNIFCHSNKEPRTL